MIRATVLFLFLLSACADSQSGRAFTPRSAATEDVVVNTPNQSVARRRDLDEALERSLAAEEAHDRSDLHPRMAPAGVPSHDAKPAPAPVASFR